uniref:CLIP domain-containing serine protease n=2 Tax=Clastoptera arizonana TaxID=38151 RepID=A0A1B6DLX7_9HEMI
MVDHNMLNVLFFSIQFMFFSTIYSVKLYVKEGSENIAEAYMANTDSRQQDYPCTAGSYCIPLSACKLVIKLMDTSCLASNKLRDLTCGYQGEEPMICCPRAGIKNEQGPLLNQNSCGQPILYNWWSNQYSGIGAMPWVVRIGFRNKQSGAITYPCCGSIISQHVILTSAHCALAQNARQTISSVRVGEFDTSTNPDCAKSFCAHPVKDIAISHVIIHPGYEPKTFRHNIALLVLKENLNFSLTAQPVCLRKTIMQLAGLKGKLVGWGKIPGQTETPSVQQTLDLPILARVNCTQVYGDVIPITVDQLCVGGEDRKDACSGFGGAPLLHFDNSGPQPRYFQVGIVSFGSDKCGTAGVPSVYTRVDRYTDWIRYNTPEQFRAES